MTFGEIVSVVDRFYEEPLNRRIPVSEAIRVVALEARGAGAATVDAQIRLQRQLSTAAGAAASPPGGEPAK
jgi:hypothetical protein